MNTPRPKVTRVIVGFFNVNGEPDTVECLCTGKGPVDYANLATAMQKRYPKVPRNKIVRTGAIIELRDPAEDPGYIDLRSGLTLRQLFDSPDGLVPPRSSLRIGRAFFNGSPVNVMLTYNRAAGSVGVIALPRVKMGDTPINFGNRISPMLLVEGLERLVKEVMGNGVRALELNTRKGGGK